MSFDDPDLTGKKKKKKDKKDKKDKMEDISPIGSFEVDLGGGLGGGADPGSWGGGGCGGGLGGGSADFGGGYGLGDGGADLGGDLGGDFNRGDVGTRRSSNGLGGQGAEKDLQRASDRRVSDMLDQRTSLGEAQSLEAIIAGDRDFTREVAGEADRFVQVLRREQESEGQLERETQGLTGEARQLQEKERRLAADVAAVKAQLAAARDAHREVDLSDLMAAADRSLVGEELDFLTRKADDEMNTLGFLQRTRLQLQNHNEDLKSQMVALERDRQELKMEVERERQASKDDERQVVELRNDLEKLRREIMVKGKQRQEEEARELKLRDLKKGAELSDALPGHSWAQSISTPGAHPQQGMHGPYAPMAPPGSSHSSPVRGGLYLGTQAPGVGVHF